MIACCEVKEKRSACEWLVVLSWLNRYDGLREEKRLQAASITLPEAARGNVSMSKPFPSACFWISHLPTLFGTTFVYCFP